MTIDLWYVRHGSAVHVGVHHARTVHRPAHNKLSQNLDKALFVAGCAALRSFSRPPLCLSQNHPVLFQLTLLYFQHFFGWTVMSSKRSPDSDSEADDAH